MLPTKKGAFRLFRFAEVDLFLHWSWFVVAFIEINQRSADYSSVVWNILEYLTLFGIVLMHEFGHALACRSVGGQANQIILWPLGGVAFVAPPPRPGATLWSIAAGPLVNVALFPIFSAALYFTKKLSLNLPPDFVNYLKSIWMINVVLLIFNLLPIYPLDGGQIFRSLLWYPFGRARSLFIATIVGMIGVVFLIGLAVMQSSVWMGIVSIFILMNCWRGFKEARVLAAIEKMPRHSGVACPTCKTAPLQGNYWQCNQCGTKFDTFLSGAHCPQCGIHFPETACLDCGRASPITEWAHR